jgi:hypothetical protein
MFPLKEELNLPNTIQQPLLFINTETFHVAANFNAVKKYTDSTPDKCGERTVFTIKYVYRCYSLRLLHTSTVNTENMLIKLLCNG